MTKHVYVWQRVENITDNEHDGGGLFVVADNLETAKQAAQIFCTENGSQGPIEWTEPDLVIPADCDATVIAFPDKGCC